MNHETYSRVPPFRWEPGPAESRDSQAARLCAKLGIKCDFRLLHRWSVEDRERYWRTVGTELGLDFEVAPSRYLDWDSVRGNSSYLVGAKLNIVESCFLAPSAAIALIEQAESGLRRSLTTSELRERTQLVAAALTAVGLRPGDAVAIDMPMTIEAVVAYLGTIWMGGRVVSIADSFAPDEIATRLRLGEAKLVVTQDVVVRGGKRLPMYEKVRSASDIPCVVVGSGETNALALRAQDRGWDSFIALAGHSRPGAVRGGGMDTINVLFSSGTTGDPKAIPWNHATPIKCGADARYHQDVREGDRVCWPTNLGWMMGPWLLFAAFLNRAAVVLYSGSPLEKSFAACVAREGVTHLGVVPSIVKAWRQNGAFEGVDLRSLRVFSSTGECSNPDDMDWLMSLNAYRSPVIEYCGGTEIGGAYITSSVLDRNRASAFTTPTLGLDFVLLDEAGRATENGEVYLVPPSLGLSTTLLNRDHYASYFADTPTGPNGERLRRHGDEITRLPDDSGATLWQALGRSDDTMNLGGIKVSSAEIERAVVASGLVSECAAVAVPPRGGGPSLLVLYVVARELNDGGETLDSARDVRLQADLQRIVRERLNPLFKIQAVCSVEKLPRTASNKVMRRVLRDAYLKKENVS